MWRVLNGNLVCQLYLKDNPSKKQEINLVPGQTLRILPSCVHTYTAIGGDVMVLEYSPQKFEQSDVIIF